MSNKEIVRTIIFYLFMIVVIIIVMLSIYPKATSSYWDCSVKEGKSDLFCTLKAYER